MMIGAYFSDGGTPKTGLTPGIKVYDLSDDSLVVNTTMSEVANGGYKYSFTTYNPAKDYYVFCDAGATLDDLDRYAVGFNSSNEVNLTAISGSEDAADNLEASAETIVLGAAAAGSLTISDMTTDVTISVEGQYRNRVLIFRSDTTTVALRGQATNIRTTETDGRISFGVDLVTKPVAGDIFVIV